MKCIFIFIVSCMASLGTVSPRSKSLTLDQSLLSDHTKARELTIDRKDILQRRGQCCGKPAENQRQNPARKQQPVQNSAGSSQGNTIGPFQNRKTQQHYAASNQNVGGHSNQQHHEANRMSSVRTPLASSQLHKGFSSTDRRGPHTRQSLLNTGATGISTIAPTELESVSSGSIKGLSLTQPNGRPLRPPTAKVKMRGPGFIEVDNFLGEPRNTALQPGQRGRDVIRDPDGAQSIAYTDPGGKSRSRGKGGLVTAKVHKYGHGTATVRMIDPLGISEETIDHRTYGTKTFRASSDDPVNPAIIKVKAAGSVYTSMMVQNKPRD